MNKVEIAFEKLVKKKKKNNLLGHAATGAAAGILATVVTRPLEVIEQNITTQGKYFKKSWQEVAKGLLKEKALWAGTGSKIIKVAPTVGITLATFEFLKNNL